MEITVREFLGNSYNHGDSIKVMNNLELNEIIWEGQFETISDHIPFEYLDYKVVKWGIENNSIVIYINVRRTSI